MPQNTVESRHSLYQAALDAENAWIAALREQFPNERTGDTRYMPKGMGEPGTALRAAHDSWQSAQAAWHKLLMLGN